MDVPAQSWALDSALHGRMQALAETVRASARTEAADGAAVQLDALRAAAPEIDRAMRQGLYGHGAAHQRPPDVALMT